MNQTHAEMIEIVCATLKNFTYRDVQEALRVRRKAHQNGCLKDLPTKREVIQIISRAPWAAKVDTRMNGPTLYYYCGEMEMPKKTEPEVVEKNGNKEGEVTKTESKTEEVIACPDGEHDFHQLGREAGPDEGVLKGSKCGLEMPPEETILPEIEVKVFRNGTKLCCLSGPNLQEGVAAFGDTAPEAMTRWITLVDQKPESPITRLARNYAPGKLAAFNPIEMGHTIENLLKSALLRNLDSEDGFKRAMEDVDLARGWAELMVGRVEYTDLAVRRRWRGPLVK
jgi:hypothetical protein